LTNKFLFTIITVTLNDSIGLLKTINSIKSLNSSLFEYIIIDGGSTDNSIDLINKNLENINYYISEVDSGIYNAMNKGIKYANGKYLIFLNSGDILINQDLILDNFPINLDYDFIIFDLYFSYTTFSKRLIHPKVITIDFLLNKTIAHPSTFIKRDLFFRYGFYDERLKIVSDWSFFLKIFLRNNPFYVVYNVPIAIFDTNGVSSLKKDLLKNERDLILKEEFSLFYNNHNSALWFSMLYDLRNIKYLVYVNKLINRVRLIYYNMIFKLKK
jgi:glycosyltransferase involved in cell wall biosynthesis